MSRSYYHNETKMLQTLRERNYSAMDLQKTINGTSFSEHLGTEKPYVARQSLA